MKKKAIPILLFIIAIIIPIILLSLSLNKEDNIHNESEASSQNNSLPATNDDYYGKGLIHYVTHTYGNFSKAPEYQIPITDNLIPQYKNKFIEGVDCSRFKDLTEQDINYMLDLKLDFVILGFGPLSWYNIEKSPENYDFTIADQWVKRLNSNGIDVVVQLWGTPTFYSGQNSPRSGNTGNQILDCQNFDFGISDKGKNNFHPYNKAPQDYKDYVNFVNAVATHYSTEENSPLRVKAFSLWNEPNIQQFYDGDAKTFVQLHNRAYDAIKSIDSNYDVWGVNLLNNWGNPKQFLFNLYKDNPEGLKFDFLAIHTYPFSFGANPIAEAPTKGGTFSLTGIKDLQNYLVNLDSTNANKKLIVTEIGYRSNIENNWGYNHPTTTNISLQNKADKLNSALNYLNTFSLENNDTIIGVANNVLYTPWKWWSTGLMTYEGFKEPAYNVFKNWNLVNSSLLPDPKDPSNITFKGVHNENLYVFNNDFIWIREGNTSWEKITFEDFITQSPNGNQILNSVKNFDTVYYTKEGALTIIKGNSFWYRVNENSIWEKGSLKESYYDAINAQQLQVPLSGIDSAYFDNSGAYTIIKGNKYWYRKKGSNTWYSNTLKSTYFNSKNAEKIGVPIDNIDSAYFDASGAYTVIKGDKYWYRKSPESDWYTNTLISAYK